jgi:hypothetical protein
MVFFDKGTLRLAYYASNRLNSLVDGAAQDLLALAQGPCAQPALLPAILIKPNSHALGVPLAQQHVPSP